MEVAAVAAEDPLMIVDSMGVAPLERTTDKVVGRPATVLVTDDAAGPGRDTPTLRHRDGHAETADLGAGPVVRPESTVRRAVYRASIGEDRRTAAARQSWSPCSPGHRPVCLWTPDSGSYR